MISSGDDGEQCQHEKGCGFVYPRDNQLCQKSTRKAMYTFRQVYTFYFLLWYIVA